MPIEGTLDLHSFHPRDVHDLITEYISECRKRGILEIRIIHGKGTGALRRTVHAVLQQLSEVSCCTSLSEETPAVAVPDSPAARGKAAGDRTSISGVSVEPDPGTATPASGVLPPVRSAHQDAANWGVTIVCLHPLAVR